MAPMLVDVRPIWGIGMIAEFIAVSLWALSCMQTFVYFVHYQKDSLWVKLTVVWIWMLSTTHIVMLIVALYKALVINFGDYSQFGTVDPEVIWLLLPTTLIAITVQIFFIYRIYIFSGRKTLLPAILMFFVVYQLASNIFTLYKGNTISSLVQLFKVDSVMLAYYGVAAAADAAIACTMIVMLMRRRISDGFERSNQMIYRLIVLSINSGLWTAVFAIGVLIMSVVYENKLHYTIFYFPLAHLYSNSLLANVTARKYIKQRSVGGSTLQDVNVLRLKPAARPSPQIIVSTETLKRTDDIEDPVYSHSHSHIKSRLQETEEGSLGESGGTAPE